MAPEWHRCWGHGAAIGVDRLWYLALEVLFSAEHRAPGGGATGAVGKGADDAITQAIVVALALAQAEHRAGWAAAAKALRWIIEAGESIEVAAPLLKGCGLRKLELGFKDCKRFDAQAMQLIVDNLPPELEELTPFAARRRSLGASPTPTRRFLRRESSFSFDPGDVSSPRRRHSALLEQMRDVLFDSPAGSRQVSRQSSFADDADAFLKANS